MPSPSCPSWRRVSRGYAYMHTSPYVSREHETLLPEHCLTLVLRSYEFWYMAPHSHGLPPTASPRWGHGCRLFLQLSPRGMAPGIRALQAPTCKESLPAAGSTASSEGRNSSQETWSHSFSKQERSLNPSEAIQTGGKLLYFKGRKSLQTLNCTDTTRPPFRKTGSQEWSVMFVPG